MGEWDEGERRGQGWIDAGVGLRERGRGNTKWMKERGEEVRRDHGWMDRGVG